MSAGSIRGRGAGAPAALMVALVALVAALVAVPAAPAAAYDEGTIVQLANEARWSNGQAGLISNSDLDAVAYAWAQHMASTGVMEHNPNVTTQVPSGWRSVGENVAQGYSSGGSVHDGWMNSSGHRANILGDYTDIGVALIDGGGSSWAVQVFARYEGHVGPGAPAPEPEEQPAEEAQPEPEPVPPPVEVPPAPEPTPAPTSTPSATPTPTPTVLPTPVMEKRDAASETDPLPIGAVVLTIAALVLLVAGLLWWLLRRRGGFRALWKPRGSSRSLEE
jgi:hypothetical protein